MNTVHVRLWGSLREATGIRSADLSAGTLAEVLDQVRQQYPSPRVAKILDLCTVMVDEEPLQGDDPAAVVLHDAATVDLLPPFAGG